MKTILRHTVPLLLVPNLALGQMGVTVHQLYCLCKGEAVSSLFSIEPSCQHHAELAQLPPCCRMAAAQASCQFNDDQDRDHSCNDSATDYFQLDELAIPSSGERIDLPGFDLSPAVYQITLDWQKASLPSYFPIAYSNPPPPLIYGKTLRIQLQSHLC